MEHDDPEGPDDLDDRDDRDDEPLDSLTGQPVTYRGAKLDVLTPMGQIESYGDFAGGLGARRVKIALFVSAVLVVLPVLLAR